MRWPIRRAGRDHAVVTISERNAANSNGGRQTPEFTSIGGEFLDPACEGAFEWERLGETHRHSRILLIGSVFLNSLFFISDWRFAGTPHFGVAIVARSIVVTLALAGLVAIPYCRSPRLLNALMVGWMITNAMAVTALVSSRSNIALFVVIMLPIIYYLVVQARFRLTVIAGVGTSAMLLAGYGEHHASQQTAIGLILAMLMLNAALVMSISHRNRLQRLQWLGARNERRIAAELAESREMLERMFAASPVPMVVTAGTGGAILHVNDSALELIEATREELIGKTLDRFYADPEDQKRLGAILERDGIVSDFEIEVRSAKGSPRFVLLKTAMVRTRDGLVNMSGIIDITRRRKTQQSLEWLASTDGLTGFANRATFLANGRAEIVRAQRGDYPLSLLMVDLDHFKAVNDTFGHQGGDRALRAFAGLCRARLRATDVVGRVGGEEFAILLPHAGIPGAAEVAEQLRAGLAALVIPGTMIRLTTSIGVTTVAPDEIDLDAAIARADRALYRAKSEGRNRVSIERPNDPTILRLAV